MENSYMYIHVSQRNEDNIQQKFFSNHASMMNTFSWSLLSITNDLGHNTFAN